MSFDPNVSIECSSRKWDREIQWARISGQLEGYTLHIENSLVPDSLLLLLLLLSLSVSNFNKVITRFCAVHVKNSFAQTLQCRMTGQLMNILERT